MWKNIFEGTEAALAAALEHASFPQSDEEQALRNESKNDPSKSTSDDAQHDETNILNKSDGSIVVVDKDGEDVNELDKKTTPKQNNKTNVSEPGDDAASKSNSKAWYAESDDVEEPTLDNWFSIPVPPISLPVALPSMFSSADNGNDNGNYSETAKATSTSQGGEILESLQTGWGNLQKAAQEQFSEAQRIFQDHLDSPSQNVLRDLSLPLDEEALLDGNVVYLTDRIITMSHPMLQYDQSKTTPTQKMGGIAHLLQKRHSNHYMIWNLSEIEYDYSIFEDRVMPAPFPGSPCPPLGYLVRLILSIEHWLKSSKDNVAVFHCLTGKGRTATLLACFLAWTGEAGFESPDMALDYIAKCKNTSVNELTIPSQRRYVSYFTKILEDGARPKAAPVTLKRIIMSQAPQFDSPPPSSSNNTSNEVEDDDDKNTNNDESKNPDEEENQLGCAPYIQIFKGGELIQTTAATSPNAHLSSRLQGSQNLPFVLATDGPISFPMELGLQGDILFRCRHLSSTTAQKISVFRAAFHTGYVETSKVLRFTKVQLDGIPVDGKKEEQNRFPDDFFVDLIFESYVNSTNTTTTSTSTSKNQDLAILQSKHDSILYKDSHFWDIVASRRREQFISKKVDNDLSLNLDDDEQQNVIQSSPLAGRIVGRRRDVQPMGTEDKNEDGENSINESADALSANGIFGFEMVENDKESIDPVEQMQIFKTQKAELLKIFNATEDDDIVVVDKQENDYDDGDEEIVFDTNDNETQGNLVFNSSEGNDEITSEIKKLANDLDNIVDQSGIKSQTTNLAKDNDNDVFKDDNQLEDLDDLENFLNQM